MQNPKPITPLKPRRPLPSVHSTKPAAVGARIGAALIDIIIVSILSYMICLPFFKILHLQQAEELLKSQMAQLQKDPSALDPELLSTLLPILFGVSVLALVLLFLMHAYYIYFESTSGQTPGKKVLGLRVVNLEGGPITRKQAVYREMIRWYLDGLFLFPAFIAIYSTPKRQRVGDLLAKTMVVEV
jgi:uncharacterized RDD family membrane protein YckC